ncbi:MAG TPA: IS200/IS605 family accessory protein TnpB-related protein [Candidatus Bathyarchaeia archaeon]|nr:IS200/IS605 family accessory protein TnpB-related protein [Candidatus Bathyarchaeia archaeon]
MLSLEEVASATAAAQITAPAAQHITRTKNKALMIYRRGAGIRGFYFNLRRKLGEKKAADKIKSLKNIEFLQVNHELHKISKAIVEEATRTNAVIVLGKFKGIRKSIKGSRRMRRLINNFPYYRLVQYIKYKAAWMSF